MLVAFSGEKKLTLSRGSVGRNVALVVSLLVLFGTGGVGVNNVIAEWGDVESNLQRAVTAGVGIYGVLGLIAGIGILLRKSWGFHISVAWALVTTAVGTLAVIAYGGQTASIGAAAGAFAVTAVATALVVFLVRIGIR